MKKPFNVILMYRQLLPLNEIMEQFRASRDDIEARVKELLQRFNNKTIIITCLSNVKPLPKNQQVLKWDFLNDT